MKQIMQAKDMLSKKIKFLFLLLLCTLSLSQTTNAQDLNIDKVKQYLNNIDQFSASFIQNDGETIEEGKIYIGEKRVRLNYLSSSKIIILSKNKAMYHDSSLEETEFFNPNNTSAKIFFDIFKDNEIIKLSNIKLKDNYFEIKKVINSNDQSFNLSIVFENNPVLIRKINLINENISLSLSLSNHNYNTRFDKNFFRMIPPSGISN